MLCRHVSFAFVFQKEMCNEYNQSIDSKRTKMQKRHFYTSRDESTRQYLSSFLPQILKRVFVTARNGRRPTQTSATIFSSARFSSGRIPRPPRRRSPPTIRNAIHVDQCG